MKTELTEEQIEQIKQSEKEQEKMFEDFDNAVENMIVYELGENDNENDKKR